MSLDLSAFEDLQHGWDGDDSLAPELETIENFSYIVDSLLWPKFDIYAEPNGLMNIESADDTGPTTFHLQVSTSKWSMYVRINGRDQVKFYSDGTFDLDDFPFNNAQIALDTLR